MNDVEAKAGGEQDSTWFLIRVCLVASLGGLLFGFDTAVISGTITSVQEKFDLSEWNVGWFASSALLGCIVGAACAGGFSDRWGRKPALIVAAILFIVSAIGSALPPTFDVLILARKIGGLGVGIASVVAPTYIAEFSPSKARGRLIALYQLSIVVGILIAYMSNLGLQTLSQSLTSETDAQASETDAQTSETDIITSETDARTSETDVGWIDWLVRDEVWRAMFGAETIPALLFLGLLCFSPESPRWLILHGDQQRGRALLRRIQPAVDAEAEYDQIVSRQNDTQLAWTEVLRPEYRRALLVGVGLSFFGQLTGVNVVVYFGPSILESAGFVEDGALAFQVGFGAINLIFTLIALAVIDSWGRRPLLIGGMFVVSATLLIVSGLFYALDGQEPDASGGGLIEYGIVLALAVYFAAVALSICAVIWVLTPEVFPNRLRATGVSISTFVNWGTNSLSVLWFPVFTEAFSMHAAFLVFSAICMVAACYFYVLVPETRQRSLEEIEASMTSLAPTP